MTTYNMQPFVDSVKKILEAHYLGAPGQYAQFIKQDAKNSRNLSASVYGCAIAVNILYTIGALPTDLSEKALMIKQLQSFQNPENGLFENPGNFATHTTAFVAGALELLDAKPLYKAFEFEKYNNKDILFKFMDEIDWENDPWLGAHLGAGIYASMILTGTDIDKDGNKSDFENNYFEWLGKNSDPADGLWKASTPKKAAAFSYLAAAFHYVFNYEYAKRSIPNIDRLLDSCLNAYLNGDCIDFSQKLGWPDIDFTYLLYHAQLRSGKRFNETSLILNEIADGLCTQLLNSDICNSDELNNTNTLFAVVSAVACLQEALPGKIITQKPLKLVINRRPFL